MVTIQTINRLLKVYNKSIDRHREAKACLKKYISLGNTDKILLTYFKSRVKKEAKIVDTQRLALATILANFNKGV